jgi:hypothetical protein
LIVFLHYASSLLYEIPKVLRGECKHPENININCNLCKRRRDKVRVCKNIIKIKQVCEKRSTEQQDTLENKERC